MPAELNIDQLLETERPNKKLKGSRIDKALDKHRKEQLLKFESSSAQMEMTMTSKSKILAQMQMKSEKLELNVNEQW